MTATYGTSYYPLDLQMYQGATFSMPVEWTLEDGTAVDLTGASAELDIRDKPDSSQELFTATTDNGYITISGNTITITIPSTITADFAWKRGIYDLLITMPDGQTIKPILRGSVEVLQGVTR